MSIKWFIVISVLSVLGGARAQGLELDFYKESCPDAEKIISDYVKEHIPHAPTLAATLLRMHFHDCFVRGCDASVLLNFTRSDNNETEKVAIANKSLRGFDFIDRVKALLEAKCPGVVSCADIVALTARDAVGVIGGPNWRVPTGRRDGLRSNATEAKTENIPAPTFEFSQLQAVFASKGLNVTDLVFLSGAHTIGVAHCASFSNRLYNFNETGHQDPSMDGFYAANLRKYKCKIPNDNTSIVEMDPGSFRTFDLGYYKNVVKRRGLFQSDAALRTNTASMSLIEDLISSPLEVFFEGFAQAMEKMGRIGVKTGTEGEIRKNCAVVNS